MELWRLNIYGCKMFAIFCSIMIPVVLGFKIAGALSGDAPIDLEELVFLGLFLPAVWLIYFALRLIIVGYEGDGDR